MPNIEYRVVLNACLFLFQRYLTCCPGVCDEIYMHVHVRLYNEIYSIIESDGKWQHTKVVK